jgi:hypothetical protein
MKKLIAILGLIPTLSSFAGSLYTEGSLWDTKVIDVCFASGEKDKRELSGDNFRISNWSEGNKKKIKGIINSEYKLERTGIAFDGWKNCDENPKAELVIFYGKKLIGNLFTDIFTGSTLGLSSIGPSAFQDLPQYMNAKSFVWLYSDGLNRATATHEFGHSLGLHHEHYRWEAGKDPRCKKAHVDDAGIGPGYAKAYIRGEYDPESIMSYCTIREPGGFKKGLSPKDVELLKYLYP